jgi:hypothetical protein
MPNFIMQLYNKEYKRGIKQRKNTNQWYIESAPTKHSQHNSPKTNKLYNLLIKKEKTQALKKPTNITKV